MKIIPLNSYKALIGFLLFFSINSCIQNDSKISSTFVLTHISGNASNDYYYDFNYDNTHLKISGWNLTSNFAYNGTTIAGFKLASLHPPNGSYYGGDEDYSPIYDSENHIAVINCPGKGGFSFRYDFNGRLVKVIDSLHTGVFRITYPSASSKNPSRIVISSIGSPIENIPSDTLKFQYDSNHNFFSSVALPDAISFMEQDIGSFDYLNFGVFSATNNVVNIIHTNSNNDKNTYSYSYTYSQNGYPLTMSINKNGSGPQLTNTFTYSNN
jgi:hypothetical protein